jgi:hypothetical protein
MTIIRLHCAQPVSNTAPAKPSSAHKTRWSTANEACHRAPQAAYPQRIALRRQLRRQVEATRGTNPEARPDRFF